MESLGRSDAHYRTPRVNPWFLLIDSSAPSSSVIIFTLTGFPIGEPWGSLTAHIGTRGIRRGYGLDNDGVAVKPLTKGKKGGAV